MDELALDVALRTDPGKEPSKQVNEDACGERKTAFGHLVVVCDGMGGHSGGREASHAALEAIFRTFDVSPTETPARDVMRLAIEHANEMVFKLAPDLRADSIGRPGSTAVAIVVHAHGAEIGHVGDSRCYRVRGHAIEAMTKDHSIVQEMVDAHLLTPEQAKDHPDANRITRALGTRMDVKVDVASVDYVAGDVFVLCSDGLSDVVEPDEILKIVTGGSAEQAAGQLVDLANARGGPDNITVTVVRTRSNAAFRGVAKTLPDHPADVLPPALAAPQKTLVQAPVAAAVEVVPAAVSGPTLPVEEPPPSLPPPSTRRKTPVGVILAVVVVVLGLAVGIFAVYKYTTTPKHVPPVLAVHDAAAAPPATAVAPTPIASDEEVEPLRALSDGGVTGEAGPGAATATATPQHHHHDEAPP